MIAAVLDAEVPGRSQPPYSVKQPANRLSPSALTFEKFHERWRHPRESTSALEKVLTGDRRRRTPPPACWCTHNEG